MNPKKKNLIPMSSPEITDVDREAVLSVLDTKYLSIGPRIKEFEAAIREYIGSQSAIGVSSGTSGLHLCIRAAKIEPGDLVITTPFSFVSSTNVILFERAIPVFVDVEANTGNLDMQQTLEAVEDLLSGGKRAEKWLPRKGAGTTCRLKAVLPVDVFGQPADYDILMGISKQHNLTLIEDSCEALGAEYKGKKAGKFGDYGVFAFYPNKQITTGEGGVIVTDNPEAANLMKALRNQGRAPGDTWLQHTYLGYNYRLNEMSAALGLTQLARIEAILLRREQVAHWYNQYLKDTQEVEIPFIAPATTRMSWFVYVIRIAKHIDRKLLAACLEKEGIAVRPYFSPIHLQPYMIERFGYQRGDYPITEDLGKRGLALPFSSIMSQEQVALVCEKLRTCIRKFSHK
ncbi:MAG TPA: DegT/DnrJ/EryC1/StrS family aminotransferase [Anaerolineae bacterium]|nr:DegT/DnrJ/EryC1/StrS family aminotransferase [Anaerolineae bacterium]